MNKQSRKKYVKTLTNLIKDIDISKEIEEGIYSYTKQQFKYNIINEEQFQKIYKNKFIMILMNLKNKKNVALLTDVLSRKIDPKILAFKTHQELFPEVWIKRYEKQQEINLQRMAKQIEFTESIYVCRKCKQNKNVYYQMQTRSADEPMTTFISCVCGNRWKC